MNKKIIYIFMMIFILIINGCVPKSTTGAEKMPGIDILMEEFNKKVVILIFPGNPPVYKNEDKPSFLMSR